MEAKHAVRLAARGEKRFTQADAAEYLGVSRRTYEAWERESNPREPSAFVLAVILRKVRNTYTIRRRRRYV
jgi:DNA-binding XRE family transcriptional regulator